VSRKALLGVALLVAMSMAGQSASAATLKSDYGFQDTLASSCCNALSLTDFGTGQAFAQETVGSRGTLTVRTFPEGSGLQGATNLAGNSDFSVEVLFRFESVSGYRKILDFKAAAGSRSADDAGLYVHNGLLNFYPVTEAGTIEAGAWHDVVLTRDGSTGAVTAYLDGAQQFQFTDTAGAVIGPDNQLSYFVVDAHTGGGVSSAGAVARIRTYDGALTPSETLPDPVAGSTANAEAVKGTVLVKEPGSGKFVPLAAADQIPIGSELDTTKGTMKLTTAAGAGKTQSGTFGGGLFKLGQSKSPKPVTQLKLTGKLRCARRGKTARAAASRSRRLFGNARGRFRTRGRNSTATVRGTRWLVKDTCAGTLTIAQKGTVVVRDLVKRRTKVLHTGQRYLARSR
jgi:hypothetical protein